MGILLRRMASSIRYPELRVAGGVGLSFDRGLLRAGSVEECWQILQQAARELGCNELNVRLAGQRFGKNRPRSIDSLFWQMRLNLPGNAG